MMMLLKRSLAALLLVLATSLPAAAQWQVPDHAVPIGRGAGTGFKSAAPATAGRVLLDKGAAADPAFTALSGGISAIDSAGAVTLDGELQCITGLTSAANKFPYYTGSATCALADLSSAFRTWLTTSSSANLRGVLSDEVGTGAAYFVGGALGTPASGTATNLTGLPISTGVSGLGTGIATFLATPSSANFAATLTDETGTGLAVLATSPVLTTPNLGTPSAATLTNATGLPVATGISGLGTGVATVLATPSSANLASALTDETGSGANVFATSPTLTTPNLGTPSAATLTNATGLPVSTGVSGLGSGVATWLATASSANLRSALTDEVGTGAAYFVGGALGTPASGTLTNATGLPISTGVSGLGTGIAAALAVNTGSAGAPVLFNGAGGTPSSLTLTNATGLPISTLPACIGDAGSGGTKGLVPAPATGDATKFLRGDCTFVAIPGGGDALVANPLSQFAATSSAQLAGVISDETGTGKVVLDTSPQISAIELGAASDTTLTRASAGNLAVEGNAIYRAGGTDVAMADGGTGASLTDPNADRILFWDDSAGANTWLTPSASLVINGTTLSALEVWGGAISDETTAITTGTAALSFSIPYAFTVVGVYCTLNTVSSSGTPTFDINEAGVSIISTKVVIDASEYTGGSSGYQGTAAGAAVISDSSIAAFAQITVDIDTAGTGAKGAKCMLIGYR